MVQRLHKAAEQILDKYKNGYRDFRNLNLDGENFDNQDFSGADFSNTSLLGASFKSATLHGCNFSYAEAGVHTKWVPLISLVSLLIHLLLGILAPFVGYASIHFFLPESFNLILGSGIALLFVIAIVLNRYSPVAFAVLGLGVVTALGTFALLLARTGVTKAFQYLWLVLGCIASIISVRYLASTVSSSVNNDFLRWTALFLIVVSPFLLYQEAVKGIKNFGWVRIQVIDFVSWFGTSFKEADLRNTNFSKANLNYTNFVRAKVQGSQWLGANGVENALMLEHYLEHPEIQALAISGYAQGAQFAGLDLTGINLENANLKKSDFTGTVLSKAILKRADLSDSCLEKAQLADADLTNAILTGSCIENWNINSDTKLEDVLCEYVYFRKNSKERRPSSENFKPNEFATLVRKEQETVDLIFQDGIDWKAFLLAFQELREQYDDEYISIQAIEKKSNEAFLIRLEVSKETDKIEVEASAKQLYLNRLAEIEAWYREKLQLQGVHLNDANRTIATERQRNTKLMRVLDALAQNQGAKYDMRGAQFSGGFADNIHGDQIGGIINNKQ